MLNINFPIYPIRAYNNIIKEDGIIYIDTYYSTYVLDNKNLEGTTLAERRAKCNSNLYPLNEKIADFKQLVLSKHKLFIDKYGDIVKYKKTRNVIVSCREVLEIKKTLSGAYLVYVEDCKNAFIYDTDFLIHYDYALIFNTKHGKYLFGFTDIFLKPFKIKI